MMIIVPTLSFYSASALLQTQRIIYQADGIICTFPSLAAVSLKHPCYFMLVQTATCISCIGSCVGSMIFLAELLEVLFSIRFGYCVAILFVPLTALSWIRSFRELSSFILFSILSCLFSAIIFNSNMTITAVGSKLFHWEA